MSINFRVNGEPKGQPRPRAWTRKMGKNLDGSDKVVARVYDDKCAEGWKGLIALAARPHMLAEPMLGPVLVNATFVFPRPNKHFVANNPAKPLRADAPYWHTKKPDRDNCEKLLLDTLKSIGGFWHDDCQVCAGEIRKIYGPVPGAVVEIETLEPVGPRSEAKNELPGILNRAATPAAPACEAVGTGE